MLKVLYRHAKFGGARISLAARAAKNVEFLWPPIVMGKPLYFCRVVSSVFFFFYVFFLD